MKIPDRQRLLNYMRANEGREVNAFVGRECPICGNVMKMLRIEDSKYTTKSSLMPTIQHNIPISKGGKHELGNISVICHSCNVSVRNKETGDLNSQEVIDVWNTIGNQSATQVRLGKVRVGNKEYPKEITTNLGNSTTPAFNLSGKNDLDLEEIDKGIEKMKANPRKG